MSFHGPIRQKAVKPVGSFRMDGSLCYGDSIYIYGTRGDNVSFTEVGSLLEHDSILVTGAHMGIVSFWLIGALF